MNPIRNILVPTDFSDAARGALRYACGLADALGASLHVLHAFQPPMVPSGYLEVYVPDPELVTRLSADAEARLEMSLTPDEKRRYRAVLVQRSGDPVHEILDYVREHGDIDLIVTATHGRGGVSRFMMGSVADRLVREAPCPVLTLRNLPAAARTAA